MWALDTMISAYNSMLMTADSKGMDKGGQTNVVMYGSQY